MSFSLLRSAAVVIVIHWKSNVIFARNDGSFTFNHLNAFLSFCTFVSVWEWYWNWNARWRRRRQRFNILYNEGKLFARHFFCFQLLFGLLAVSLARLPARLFFRVNRTMPLPWCWYGNLFALLIFDVVTGAMAACFSNPYHFGSHHFPHGGHFNRILSSHPPLHSVLALDVRPCTSMDFSQQHGSTWADYYFFFFWSLFLHRAETMAPICQSVVKFSWPLLLSSLFRSW